MTKKIVNCSPTSEYECIVLCIYLCNRNKFSIQTALQNKVLSGPDEHGLPSALCDGPDGTKQLRHLRKILLITICSPAIQHLPQQASTNVLLHNVLSSEQIRHERSRRAQAHFLLCGIYDMVQFLANMSKLLQRSYMQLKSIVN